MLAAHRHQIRQLCEASGVRRLELFGSAATGAFDPQTSDYDFFVEFNSSGEDNLTAGAFKRYMRLKLGLEDLLGRPVDLVEVGAVTNPYFLQHTAQSKRVEVYRAA